MAEFSRSIALVIGINDYQDGIPALETARHDAKRLAELLQEQHGYEVILLLDEDASQESISKLLNETLPDQLSADDRVLFYFAGHGVALDSDGGPNGYLLPQDAKRSDEQSFIHMPALSDALCALDCRHMLVILDSCFGGAFRWSSSREAMVLPEVIHQERYERFTTDPAWQVITSASHDQVALDELISGSLGRRSPGANGTPHSPFALALFEGLEGAADLVPADNRDGLITATELYVFLEDRLQTEVLEHGKQQTPRLWPMAKHDKGEFVFHVPGHELNLPPAPPLNLENNPYLGLRSFDASDKHLFFGRDEAIQELLERVKNQPMTVVLGASGTGKSSLVKAGLVPNLPEGWKQLPVVRPGSAPLRHLRDAFCEGLDISTRVKPNTDSITRSFRDWLDEHPKEILFLLLDQFEELFTMSSGKDSWDALQSVVAALLTSHPQQVRVLVTLRLDFEPQFREGKLALWWEDARYVVSPMTQNEIREVIEKPASEKVLYFKPAELVDELINEVIANPGGLPLLSFALSEMYLNYVSRKSDDRAIETEDYEAVGGVVGSLRSRADQVFDDFDPAGQQAMQRVMLRMVSAESADGLARRRVPRSELEYEGEEESRHAAEVIKRLSEARLVVEGIEDDKPYVEPAHDALVRAWDKLIVWINEVKREPLANLRFRSTLARAAAGWEEDAGSSIGKAILWSDAARASQLNALLQQDHSWVNRQELAFIQESLKAARRRKLITVSTVIGVAVLAVMAMFFAYFANEQRKVADLSATEAKDQRDRALSAILARRAEKTKETTSLLYAVQAYRFSDTPQARSALMTSLQVLPAVLTNEDTFEYLNHPSGEVTFNAPLEKWDRVFAAVRLRGEGNDQETFQLMIFKRGVTQDPTFAELDSRYVPLDVPVSITDAVFNQAGSQLLVTGYEFTGLIDLDENGWSLRPLPEMKPRFALDDTLIVGISAAEQPILLDARTLTVRELPAVPGITTSVAIHPNGKTVFIAGTAEEGAFTDTFGDEVSEPAYIGVWDLDSKTQQNLEWFDGYVTSMQLSSDGRFLVIDGSRTLRLIPTERNPNVPRKGSVPAVNWIESEQREGVGKFWGDFWQGAINDVSGPVISPDNRMLAFSSAEESITSFEKEQRLLWNLETRQAIISEFKGFGYLTFARFSPDSSLLILGLMGQEDYWIRFIDTQSGTGANELEYSGLVETIEFSEDSRRLWLSHDDSSRTLLIKKQGWQGKLLPSGTAITTLAYSPASEVIASAGEVLQLWNNEGELLGQPSNLPYLAERLDFSRDGKLLAASGRDGLSVWAIDGNALQELWNHTVSVGSASFDETGSKLALVSYDQDPGEGLQVLNAQTGEGWNENGRRVSGPAMYLWGRKEIAVLNGYDDHGDLLILDAETLQKKHEEAIGSAGNSLSFNTNDGLSLAVGQNSGSVRVFQLGKNRTRQQLRVFGLWGLESVAYDAANNAVVVAGNPGVELWDVRTQQRLGNRITTGNGEHFAAISTDGSQLATVADGQVLLWDFSANDWADRACEMVNRNLNQVEWDAVIPDMDYRCSCTDLPPHPDFPEASCSEGD